jgi:hypothetical protein
MAYKDFDGLSLGTGNNADGHTLQVNGPTLELPDTSYISDAAIQRDGADLVLDGPQGTITVEGYFSAAQSPILTAPDGTSLTPDLVESFAQSPAQYASNLSMNDASPIGAVDEASGDATITRTDGTTEQISIGTPVYQGDIVETSADGAVNITFSDESSFAVSEDARMAIDEYVYDPDTEEGAQNFSALKGVFVFTSGLIGRDDPDDVSIDTPSGSIGIRGTIIAGDVDNGEITVVEGAIVLRDNNGNELTLDEQFETGRFNSDSDTPPTNLGQLSAQDVSSRFASVENVAPGLFSSVNDVAGENADGPAPDAPQDRAAEPAEEGEAAQEDADANGSVDQNNDNEVDGTVDEVADTQNDEQGESEAAEASDSTEAGETAQGEGRPGAQGRGEGENRANTGPRGNESGLGGNNNGLGGDGTNATEIGTQGGNDAIGGGENTQPPTAGENRPGPGNDPIGGESADPIDPRVIDPAPTGPAPFFVSSSAPNTPGNNPSSERSLGPNFFQTAHGQDWTYDFSQDFADNNGDIVSYGIGPASLQSILNTGATVDLSNFATNGVLTINATHIIAQNINFGIRIFAQDAEGQNGGHTYDFDIYDNSGYNIDVLNTNAIEDGKILSTTVQQTSFDVGSSGTADADKASDNTAFFSNHADDIRLVNSNKNVLHLGDGNNTLKVGRIADNNENNIIFGGSDQDTFTLQNGKNDIFGMDGDDKFVLDLDNGSFKTDAESPSSKVIDGGRDGAFGDTLKLLDLSALGGTGLDFGTISNDYFRGIERIDLGTGSSDTFLSRISYNDILQMTDDRNTLIFRGDGNDSVLFTDTFTPKDTGIVKSEADGNKIFDSYEFDGGQGVVTVLIDQSGGVVTNF